MNNIFSVIDIFLSDRLNIGIPDMRITDVVEIIILSVFVYLIITFFKNSRAFVLLRGLFILFTVFVVAYALQMSTILFIGEKLINVGVIAIFLLFQPELRNGLESLGRRKSFYRYFEYFKNKNQERFSEKTLNDLISSCKKMAAVKTGALIVIENEVGLGEFIHTGIEIDSIVSAQLIINIFEKNTPLHDGAVIIKGDRILAATCYLPLSTNLEIDKSAGTRHRAALGLSEISDALVIVVSEETGLISLAHKGVLETHITEARFREALLAIQNPISLGRIEDEKEVADEGQ